MTVRIDGTNTSASPGITGSDTDTGLTFGTDTVNVVTGGSTRATVDSSGRVLIGTTTEGHPNADDLTIAGSGSAGITIRTGTTSTGGIFFSDATTGSGEYDGAIEYNQNTQDLILYTAATDAMKIDASRNLMFNSGYGSVATAYGVRAWIHFDGSAGTIGDGDARGNVSSVTDNGIGDYYLNFSSNMPDVNYAVCGSCSGDTINDLFDFTGHIGVVHNGFSSSGCQIVVTRNMSGAEADTAWNADQVCVAIVR